MFRRSLWLLTICVLGGIASTQAYAQEAVKQDPVKLEYKFTTGEVLRYKITNNMNVQMNVPGMPNIPSMPVKIVSVMKQQTSKIQENGDAEIVTTFESLKMEMAGNSQDVPITQIQPVKMILSKSGEVKSVQGLDKLALGGMQFSSYMSNFCQYCAIPDAMLNVGDKWEQTVQFPIGKGKLRMQDELLSTNAMIGTCKVANFSQDVTGDISMAMPVPGPSGAASGNSANMELKGPIKAKSTVSFSSESGRIIKTVGTTDMKFDMQLPGSSIGKPGTMNLKMNYEIVLI